MATMNPFDLLGGDDVEDPSLLIAAQQVKVAVSGATAGGAKKASQGKQAALSLPKQPAAASAAKLPSKPLPPSQAVRETKSETGRGRGGGRGYGRGRGGYNRDSANSDNSFSNIGAPPVQGAAEDGDNGRPSERRGYSGPRGGYRGGRRGGFSNGDAGDEDRPRRPYERRSGTGRGNEIKRDGAGRGNWGSPTDELAQTEEVNEGEKNLPDEKAVGEEAAVHGNKDNPANEPEEKEPEDKEMTLEEYEKVLEERRKALQAHRTSDERKVDVKQFESMQQLSNKKKATDDVFIKLGSDKDKRKEAYEKDEKAKKSVNINEFLKPAEGERLYSGGRGGRGRGRGSRGGYGGRDATNNVAAPPIEDPSHFPTLGAK